MKSVRNSTLVFLIKKSSTGKMTDICLAMKKRGFGKGRWNGVGGKQSEGEAIEDTAHREAHEEIGVNLTDLNKVAELEFRFPLNPEWDQCVHAYTAHTWSGEPIESEEMKPAWFSVEKIPFDTMWPDDIFWLPRIIESPHARIKARFVFGEKDSIQKQEIVEVSSW